MPTQTLYIVRGNLVLRGLLILSLFLQGLGLSLGPGVLPWALSALADDQPALVIPSNPGSHEPEQRSRRSYRPGPGSSGFSAKSQDLQSQDLLGTLDRLLGLKDPTALPETERLALLKSEFYQNALSILDGKDPKSGAPLPPEVLGKVSKVFAGISRASTSASTSASRRPKGSSQPSLSLEDRQGLLRALFLLPLDSPLGKPSPFENAVQTLASKTSGSIRGQAVSAVLREAFIVTQNRAITEALRVEGIPSTPHEKTDRAFGFAIYREPGPDSQVGLMTGRDGKPVGIKTNTSTLLGGMVSTNGYLGKAGDEWRAAGCAGKAAPKPKKCEALEKIIEEDSKAAAKVDAATRAASLQDATTRMDPSMREKLAIAEAAKYARAENLQLWVDGVLVPDKVAILNAEKIGIEWIDRSDPRALANGGADVIKIFVNREGQPITGDTDFLVIAPAAQKARKGTIPPVFKTNPDGFLTEQKRGFLSRLNAAFKRMTGTATEVSQHGDEGHFGLSPVRGPLQFVDSDGKAERIDVKTRNGELTDEGRRALERLGTLMGEAKRRNPQLDIHIPDLELQISQMKNQWESKKFRESFLHAVEDWTIIRAAFNEAYTIVPSARGEGSPGTPDRTNVRKQLSRIASRARLTAQQVQSSSARDNMRSAVGEGEVIEMEKLIEKARQIEREYSEERTGKPQERTH